jgi:hypothetical protein
VDADITERVPDVEMATPRMDGLDKTHFPPHKWNPLVLCRIIETFMSGTIQELYHLFIVQKSMVYYSTMINAWPIGANGDELDGHKPAYEVFIW